MKPPDNTFKAVFLDYDNLYTDSLDTQCLESVFTQIECYSYSEPAQIIDRLRGAQVAIVGDMTINARIFAASPSLKLLLVAATGTDNIDLVAARQWGVTVCHCRDYATWSLAQHAFSLLLTLTNNIVNYQTLVASGAWQQASSFCLPQFPLIQLAGKTLGIVGYGASGQRMAEIAKSFGMNVLIAALPGRPSDDTRIELDILLPQVDVISLHCPLTEQTRHLLNGHRLAMLKKEALLINVARGAIIDERSLADALKNGQLAGAGLDVLGHEPPSAEHPLLQGDIPHLVITPHIAWSSRAVRQEVLQQLADNARAFRAGKPIRVVS